MANTITFSGDDLKAAEAIQAGLAPTQEAVQANKQNNEGNIAANRERIESHQEGIETQVKGFADSSGDAAMNQKLSMDRTQEVIAFLIQNCGVPVRRIVAPGAMGTAAPAAPNETAQGRAQNRRVEVKVLVNRGLAAASKDTRSAQWTGPAESNIRKPSQLSLANGGGDERISFQGFPDGWDQICDKTRLKNVAGGPCGHGSFNQCEILMHGQENYSCR